VRKIFFFAVILLLFCFKSIASPLEANNQFAIDFYLELKNSNENIFFSSYSLSSSMAMAFEGANGKTANEIKTTFHFLDKDLQRQFFLLKQERFLTAKLTNANAFWLQKGNNILKEYRDVLKKYYAADMANVDFRGSPQNSAKAINQWVKNKTNNKITNLIDEKSIDSSTQIVITNAIYFKAAWSKKFNKAQTQQEDFFISDQNKAKVLMMRKDNADAEFNYMENNDLQAIEMPYLQEKLSMIVILPKNNDLASLEKKLSLQQINDWKSKFKKQRVDLLFPKFSFNKKYLAKEILSKMGIVEAFSSNADFSKINALKNLYIQQVIHQAALEVDEEGSEAGASSAVVMNMKSVMLKNPIVKFYANHPFMFLILDNDSGDILFLGRLLDPR
jgi:serpin B